MNDASHPHDRDDRWNESDRSDEHGEPVPREPGRSGIPGGVKAAGIIWIGAGSLALFNVAVALGLQGADNNGNDPGTGTSCCPGLVGIAFLVCGYQTVTGQSADTRGNAIGSILFGLLQVIVAVVMAIAGVGARAVGGPRPMPPEVMLVVSLVVGVMGATLITAGVLALAGRQKYLEWRGANGPSKAPNNRSRRDRARDDDEYERPWNG